MRNNLITLMARKSAKEQRRITTNTVAAELKMERGISRNSVYAFASNGMKEYPQHFLLALMDYFDCGLDELFIVEEEAEVTTA